MNDVTLRIDNLGVVATMDGSGPHGLGLVHDACIACDGAQIVYVGPAHGAPPASAVTTTIDAQGRCALPGFIDGHTHALFMGHRADEFARRARGETYAQIMAAGGGIRSTMRHVRAASLGALVDDAKPRVARMLARGVTTIEIKSGYGLDVDSELKMLHAIAELAQCTPATLVPTLLAAHAVPPEHATSSSYIDVIVRELLPEVARAGLARFADVFVESGAFSVDDARRMLTRASDLGLGLLLAQLLHQLALLARELLRDRDAHVHLVVAAHARLPQPRHAALGHQQRRARLRARRDLELHRAIHRGDLDLRA